jgi:hypothetical protein
VLFQAFARIADSPTEVQALWTYYKDLHDDPPIVVDSAWLHAAIASLTFKLDCIKRKNDDQAA